MSLPALPNLSRKPYYTSVEVEMLLNQYARDVIERCAQEMERCANSYTIYNVPMAATWVRSLKDSL